MSDDKTRDPIDVAREVWPGLEWSGGPHGAVGTSSEPSPDFVVLALRLRDGQERVRVEFEGAMLFANITAPAGGLRAALTEARRLTLDRLEAAAALCRDPAPAATPEPDPTPGDGDVWAEIIARLGDGPLKDACIARRQMGIDKYGQPLQRGDGRNHAIDEGQDHLDATAYRAARLGADGEGVMESLHRAAECLGIAKPYPVPVVRHPTTGDAILLLTCGGKSAVIIASDIHSVTACEDGRSGADVHFEGGWHAIVDASPDGLRETLRMLAANDGGEE